MPNKRREMAKRKSLSMGGRVELNLNRNLLKQNLRNKGIAATHSSLCDNISTFINNKF